MFKNMSRGGMKMVQVQVNRGKVKIEELYENLFFFLSSTSSPCFNGLLGTGTDGSTCKINC